MSCTLAIILIYVALMSVKEWNIVKNTGLSQSYSLKQSSVSSQKHKPTLSK